MSHTIGKHRQSNLTSYPKINLRDLQRKLYVNGAGTRLAKTTTRGAFGGVTVAARKARNDAAEAFAAEREANSIGAKAKKLASSIFNFGKSNS